MLNHGQLFISKSRGWFLFWLVSLLAVGGLNAQTNSITYSFSDPVHSWEFRNESIVVQAPSVTYWAEMTFQWNESTDEWRVSDVDQGNSGGAAYSLSAISPVSFSYTQQNPTSWSNAAGIGHVSFRISPWSTPNVNTLMNFRDGIPEPDECGPIDVSQVVVNSTPFVQTWLWQTADSGLLQTSTNGVTQVQPFTSQVMTFVAEDVCGPVYLIEVGGSNSVVGEVFDFYGPYQPDSPDQAPASDPQIIQRQTQALSFDEIEELKEIEDSEVFTDQEKTARQNYVLYKAAANSNKAIVDELKAHNEREEARKKELDDIREANPTEQEQAAAGAAAAAAIKDIYPVAPSGPAAVPVGSQPNLTYTFPARFGGAVIDMNPFREDRLGPVATWFKSALAWLALVHFGIWVFSESKFYVIGTATAQQAKGNAIVSGTGAQATSFLAATVITTLVITFTVALVSWAFGDISFSSVVSAISVSPLTGMASGALWMLEQCIPIATVLTCLLARLSFNLYAIPLFHAVATSIRFVTP